MSSPTYRWGYSPRRISSIGERHIITRNTTINGGIDTYDTDEIRGAAIVVDPYKYPDSYNRLIDQVIRRATGAEGVDRRLLPRSVFDVVNINMTYSESATEKVLKRVAQDYYKSEEFPAGEKIELSEFINVGVGVCREQSLVCGALLELLVDRGLLTGEARINRCFIDYNNGEPTAGHQWARYTASSGEPYILDVAERFYGKLNQAPQQERAKYLQPGEQPT